MIMAMTELNLKLLLVVAVCASLTAIFMDATFSRASSNIGMRALHGLLAMGFLSLTLIYTWIFIQRPHSRQSFFTISVHLLLSIKARISGKYVHSKMLESCENPMAHQKRLWHDILKLNGSTVYAMDECLKDLTPLEEFRQHHPLASYEHFRPYVERMLEGERNVLIDGSPDVYIRTSGTTGTSKYIPQKNKWTRLRHEFLLTYYITGYHHPVKLLSKILYFYVHPVVKITRGIEAETLGGIPENLSDWMFAQFITPPVGFRISSMHEAFYIHLLFGLLDPDLGVLFVVFIDILESAMKVLEKEWKNITRDIELGSLNAELNLPHDIRESLSSELRKYGAEPARAAQLRGEFEKGFQGIIKRIWPRVPVIIGIDGTCSWSRLSTTYAKGLPLLTIYYGCSECDIAMNPGPKYVDKGYIPLVDNGVFEFIKEGDMTLPDPPTFFLNEIEKDENYEIVTTQEFGLYRYRIGDVIRVVDFYKDMPVIDFLYRVGQMLNLRFEKLDQRVVLESVRAAVGQWKGTHLIEFAVAESTLLTDECSIYEPNELMPYYLFFLEKEGTTEHFPDKQKEMIDTELQSRNSEYTRFRREGAISYPRVHLVRLGAFDELQRYIIAKNGASAIQYKVPRKLRTLAMVEVMVENIVI